MSNATDAPRKSFKIQFSEFSRVFWIANIMEMLERLAYYGLRTVLPVYMVLSLEEGGPQFTHIQKGSIYAAWAVMQSGLPVVTGGFADRYGYKLTVGWSIGIKILGYLVMAYAIDIANIITDGAAGKTPGSMAMYWVFMAGALGLAGGTAIFKPGIQGILSHQLNKGNSSLGWSLFYQLVNVGGFLGPFLAGIMRLMAWKWVFISCAVTVALNYILLFTFEDPESGVEPEGKGLSAAIKVLFESAIGICEPRLMGFLVIFSGFWAMFYQLFDLLPNYISDWVDSRSIATLVMGDSMPVEWAGHLPQEYMININAGMCMLLAFAIGYLTGKVRSMQAMIAGMLVASAAIYGLGMSTNGWFILATIALFSLGELMSSPTKMRYFSELAPKGKQGLYLGYINATSGIGWALGSLIGGSLYENDGDKIVLARRYLVQELHQAEGVIESMKKTDVLPKLEALMGQDTEQLREMLFARYDPSFVWDHFALIGIASMVGLILFDRITHMKHRAEGFAILLLTGIVSGWTYGWHTGLLFAGAIALYMFIEKVKPELLPQGSGGSEEDAQS